MRNKTYFIRFTYIIEIWNGTDVQTKRGPKYNEKHEELISWLIEIEFYTIFFIFYFFVGFNFLFNFYHVYDHFLFKH